MGQPPPNTQNCEQYNMKKREHGAQLNEYNSMIPLQEPFDQVNSVLFPICLHLHERSEFGYVFPGEIDAL